MNIIEENIILLFIGDKQKRNNVKAKFDSRVLKHHICYMAFTIGVHK